MSDLFIQTDGHDMTVWHREVNAEPRALLTEHQAGPVLWAHLVATLPTRDEPLPEPTDPAVRVVDGDGETWARIGTRWYGDPGNLMWHHLIESGPLRIVTPDAPTPDASVAEPDPAYGVVVEASCVHTGSERLRWARRSDSRWYAINDREANRGGDDWDDLIDPEVVLSTLDDGGAK